MQKIFSTKIVLALSLFAMLCSSGYGALLAYEGFDYGTVNGVMTGLNGGYGFDGGWVADANYVPTSLANVTGYGFDRIGGAMMWDKNTGASRVMSRSLAMPIDLDSATEQVYYVSALVKYVDTVRYTGTEYVQVVLRDGSNAKAVFGVSSGDKYYVEIAGGANSSTPIRTLSQNNTFLMVFRLVTRNDGADRLYGLYYGAGEDTILYEPSLDTYDVMMTGDLAGIANTIAFNIGVDNEQAYIDEIRVGESWEDVVDPDWSDTRIPPIPFERGISLYVDAENVWLAYQADQTAKAFSTLNVFKSSALTFGGKTPEQMPKVIPNALNGHPVLEFDGNDYLQLAARSYMDMPRMTTFMVLKANGITTTQVIFRSAYNNINGAGLVNTALWGYYIESSNLVAHCRTNTGANRAANVPASNILNQFGISCSSWDGDRVYQQINNNTTVVGAAGANAMMLAHSSSRLGAAPTGTAYYFTGQIAELIVYNRLLTDAQKVKVGAYLADKYGLTNTLYPAASIVSCEDKWRHQSGDKVDYDQDCEFGVGDISYLAQYWLEDLLIQ